jgi:hypothetical protein
MPDEIAGDSEEYRELQRLAARNRGLLNSGGDREREIERLRKRLGPRKSETIDLVVMGIAEAMKPVVAEIKSLRARVAELEKRPSLEYCGVWSAGNLYGKGNIAPHHGSAWHCNFETSGEPGKGGADWTLMVKRGKDSPR